MASGEGEAEEEELAISRIHRDGFFVVSGEERGVVCAAAGALQAAAAAASSRSQERFEIGQRGFRIQETVITILHFSHRLL
jgi:hypothetical protein